MNTVAVTITKVEAAAHDCLLATITAMGAAPQTRKQAPARNHPGYMHAQPYSLHTTSYTNYIALSLSK
jgi:hypothetical protein